MINRFVAAVLLSMASMASHACLEYRVAVLPYDAEMTEAQLSAATTSMFRKAEHMFRKAEQVQNPWETPADGSWIHARHTDYLTQMGADGWRLAHVSETQLGILHYLERSCDQAP